ncbi:MAG: toll/interleukin-1 receptor domain-containing protein [Verrucomicrobia bacterium]|nr:toll/interleukin-1 receptor domain-containing protein [Verrucomicrobiota bacterium]
MAESSGDSALTASLGTLKSKADFKQQAFWNKFLKYLHEGFVVPVVGDELLTLHGEPGSPRTLSEYLGHLFIESFGEELDEAAARKARESSRPLLLTEAVSLHRKAAEIDSEICEIYRMVRDEIAIPVPLRQLARIDTINLFLSTTADDLLERAINETRFGGKRETKVLFYSPKRVPDAEEIERALNSGRPVVFQLFGTYTDGRYVAVTDAHFVEYVNALLSDTKRPQRLLDELVNVSRTEVKHLLLLGNQLPSWLVRFFLRVARNEPFPENSKNALYISDSALQNDLSLPRFIDKFAPSTKILPDLTPAQFVAELSERWEQTRPEPTIGKSTGTRSGEEAEFVRDAIFLSYAHEDIEAVHRLRVGLETRGLPVWMDRGNRKTLRLNPGDPYNKKIQQNIAECSFFIAIISHSAAEPTAGYLRREWSWALERLPDFTGLVDKPFIIPIIIDEVDFRQAEIPSEFKKLHYQSLPQGEPTDEFCKWIQSLYRGLKSAKRS